MYRDTRFGAVMKGLPRKMFEQSAIKYGSDRYNKGFRSWDHLIAMIYTQLSGCQSLREVEAGFNSQTAHHYHLGTRAVKRSTLSDANAHRESQVFAEVCSQLLSQTHRQLRNELSDMLYLIDSTPITLKGLGYDDWTRDSKTQRTQGVKVHVQLAYPSTFPVKVDVTSPTVNDIDIGRGTELEQGATYVFDKGYYDYNWWYRLHESGCYFVSRFKRNASLRELEVRPIEKSARSIILEDRVVTFANKHPGGGRSNDYYGTPLRRIVVNRPDKKDALVLVTNDMERSALEIASLYKQRWGIELFFKWLKQNLKIKRFLGRSENAVKIQIYTALITYLLVKFYHEAHGLSQTLALCVVELRTGLFQRPETELVLERRRVRTKREYDSLQGILAL